jgi:hypothetical protein
VIEHLPDKEILFSTIKNKLKKGGLCLLTTPNIDSINYPSAWGTLNYYDDKTHLGMPVTFQFLYDLCVHHNLRISKFRLKISSPLAYFLGLCLEPFRILLKRNLYFTWCYWGFEDLYVIENV